MKIKPNPNCHACHGTGIVNDWVDWGSTQVPMPSLCGCVEDQIPDDFDDEHGIIDLDLSDFNIKDKGYDTLEEKYDYE